MLANGEPLNGNTVLSPLRESVTTNNCKSTIDTWIEAERDLIMYINKKDLYQQYKDNPLEYIYIHVTADTETPFYAGRGFGRRACHIHGRNKKWHKTVEERGLLVRILYDNLEHEQACILEIETIATLQKHHPVENCNFSLGGEGGTYGIKQDNDWIRKRTQSIDYKHISKSMKQHWLNDEYRAKMAVRNKGVDSYQWVDINIDELMRLKSEGYTIRKLAEHFKCSKQTIQRRIKSMR